MAQNEPGRVIAFTAQMQYILVQALCQIQFATAHVINRLPISRYLIPDQAAVRVVVTLPPAAIDPPLSLSPVGA